jgi:hypothetical protein
MSKKITELHHKALKLVADAHSRGDVSRLNTDSYHVPELIRAKFAELIIEECALVASDHVVEYEGVDFGVGAVVKKHFGVK